MYCICLMSNAGEALSIWTSLHVLHSGEAMNTGSVKEKISSRSFADLHKFVIIFLKCQDFTLWLRETSKRICAQNYIAHLVLIVYRSWYIILVRIKCYNGWTLGSSADNNLFFKVLPLKPNSNELIYICSCSDNFQVREGKWFAPIFFIKLEEIKEKLSHILSINLKHFHIMRERNSPADYMAGVESNESTI